MSELGGTWRPVLLEWQGRLGPPPEGAGVLHIASGAFSVKSGDYVWASGAVAVDAEARPRRVDFIQTLGEGLRSVQAGIYEVLGDELRLRLAEGGELPPAGFDGEKGMAVYRREKAGDSR
jgi:uncharacterized protein (TIGR03067 family)